MRPKKPRFGAGGANSGFGSRGGIGRLVAVAEGAGAAGWLNEGSLDEGSLDEGSPGARFAAASAGGGDGRRKGG